MIILTVISRLMSYNSILEYLSRDDAERAVKDLDNRDLRGKVVRVAYDEGGVSDLILSSVDSLADAFTQRSGGEYRRDERRDDRDRYRDDRRDDRYRRERSRSPGRREEGRRPRSPPRREDDRRPPAEDFRRGYDDRRAPTDDFYVDRERRRDDPDRKRDDRRRDDREDRYEDRAARQPNGEGWAR